MRLFNNQQHGKSSQTDAIQFAQQSNKMLSPFQRSVHSASLVNLVTALFDTESESDDGQRWIVNTLFLLSIGVKDAQWSN